MTPELWQQVEEVLAEAWELPRSARPAFLAERCADDPRLFREVESLLAEDEDPPSPDFFERPLATLRPVSADLGAGRRLGPYLLLEEIGRGGMGAVFLAARADEEFEQRVAVKVVKWGMDTDEVVRRFRFERQVLARLEHPNIARLLDGGTTDDGRPYFVMEHVRGEPVDRYCDRHELPTRARIELFRRISAAVQFAHQNLLVHRDLKPGNILVTEEGEPKLLDFGIAKLLGPEPHAAAPSTAYGQHPMTLEYASPEQVRGEALTTASDVYSLGVLLYELLAGHRPYRTPSSSRDELSREIREDDPVKPSTRTLRRRLSGDLDAIVLKALAKDPRQRYASVEQLSEDLRHHLEGRPVLARRPTLAYQVGKLVRRHRLESALVAAVMLIVAGSGIHATVLKKRAERQRERAEEVSHFLVDLFQLPDPQESSGETVTARQLLDEAAESVLGELEEQPEDRSLLMAAIGSAYLGLRLYDRSEPLLERSLELRRGATGPSADDPERVYALLDLAKVRRLRGNPAAAEELEREALGLVGGRHLDHPRTARILNNQAGLARYGGDARTAELFYRAALAMKIRLYGPAHPEVATSKNGLATTLEELGRLDEAEKLYREALQVRIAVHGPESQEVIKTRNNLAVLLQDRGDLGAAESFFRQNLDIRLRRHGPDDPRVALNRNNLAFLLGLRGAYGEADLHYREALRVYRSALGAGHGNVAIVLRNRAALLVAMGELTDAESTIREALGIFRRNWPGGHWRIADAESVLGECLGVLGRFEEADSLLRRGYQTLEAERGPKARQTIEARERLEHFLTASAKQTPLPIPP